MISTSRKHRQIENKPVNWQSVSKAQYKVGNDTFSKRKCVALLQFMLSNLKTEGNVMISQIYRVFVQPVFHTTLGCFKDKLVPNFSL